MEPSTLKRCSRMCNMTQAHITVGDAGNDETLTVRALSSAYACIEGVTAAHLEANT